MKAQSPCGRDSSYSGSAILLGQTLVKGAKPAAALHIRETDIDRSCMSDGAYFEAMPPCC